MYPSVPINKSMVREKTRSRILLNCQCMASPPLENAEKVAEKWMNGCYSAIC
jgi:hypothetical protein